MFLEPGGHPGPDAGNLLFGVGRLRRLAHTVLDRTQLGVEALLDVLPCSISLFGQLPPGC